MCCAVKSEFVQAIEALMNKKANFDYILIETTGERPIKLRLNFAPNMSSCMWTTHQAWRTRAL